MRQMEDAAMKAYAADICRGGDITTQSLNAVVAAAAAEVEQDSVQTSRTTPGPSAMPRRAIDPMLPPIDVMEIEERTKREKMKKKAGPSNENKIAENSMWCEAVTEEDHTYYWNVKTGGISFVI